MTLQQLERRIAGLERQLAELQYKLASVQRALSVEDTFGMFADDPGFDEMVELGRESRAKTNAED